MRRPYHIFFVPIVCLMMIGLAGGADVSLSGGNPTLTIASAVAGQQPHSAQNESCHLEWTTLISDPTQKITIHSNLASPRFTLRAQPNDVTHGEEGDDITLSTTPRDFVTSIPANVTVTSPGSCTISYSASAQASLGTGTDSHTITFTIVAQ